MLVLGLDRWGIKATALHALYGAVLAAAQAEAVLLGFSKIAFTCSYLPGKANVKLLGVFYVAAFTIYAYSMAVVEWRLLGSLACW